MNEKLTNLLSMQYGVYSVFCVYTLSASSTVHVQNELRNGSEASHLEHLKYSKTIMACSHRQRDKTRQFCLVLTAV